MRDIRHDVGLSFSGESKHGCDVEARLVQAARKRMVIERQQQLATMVLMGINRIVVTDGKISVSFAFTPNTVNGTMRHKAKSSWSGQFAS